MAITNATYTPAATGSAFMDVPISITTLQNGTLLQRFDPVAYPRVGKKSTGTRPDGRPQPAPAKSMH
jgi:hypothetical protein